MQSLLQSAFLQALGYAIFNSLWQIAFLWIVVMIVNSVGKLSSSKKYFTGVIAQFAGFVWFLFTLQFYYSQCSEVIANAQSAGIADNNYYFYEPVVNNFSSGLMYVVIKTEQLLPYLSVAYIFMLLFLSARLTRAYLNVRKIRTQGLLKPDVEWKLFVKRTAGYLGINKEVTLYFSELVKSPLTLGFAKPLILIPIASLNHLSTDQLEAILLHELAHIKRADYLINIIQSVIEVILFFNPFMQLLGKLVKKERENSCDDWVLQFQYKPAMYAEALLRIAYIQTQPSFAMQASGNKGELLPRVKRMLNQQEKTHQYRNHLFALLLITVMLTTVAWFNPAANNKVTINTAMSSNRKTMVEPFTSTVDNVFYNPFYYIFTKPIENTVSITANKAIEAALPSAEYITNAFTPIAIGALREASDNIEDEIPSVRADIEKGMQEAKLELANIKIDGVSITDSAAIGAAIGNLVKKELAKIDLSSMNADLEKARIELTSSAPEIENNITEAKISGVLNQVTQQLQLLNNKKNNLDASGLLKILFEKKKNEGTKQVQEKAKEDKEKYKKLPSAVVARKSLRVWSDMQRDDYSFGTDEFVFNGINNNSYTYEKPVAASYSPTIFNNAEEDPDAESYNLNTAPDSAIVIVNHNPENDKSHTKKITVQIIGSNGSTKTYTFTVDVYQ